jgi:hypothetical protein
MSLFTYKNNAIYSSGAYSGIISYALTNDLRDSINNTYKLNITTIGSNNTGLSPYNNVTEIPNSINFQINGTDISNYCVASYYDSTQSSTNSGVPSWATSIRAILVGGGGGGSTSIPTDQRQNHNSGFDWGRKWRDQWDYHNRRGGVGGGGGGFVYISNLPVSGIQSLQVSKGSGGGGGVRTEGSPNYGYASGGGGSETKLEVTINGTKHTFQAHGAQGGVRQWNPDSHQAGGGSYTIAQAPGCSAIGSNGYGGSIGADSTGSSGGSGGAGAPSGDSYVTTKPGVSYGNGGYAGGSDNHTTINGNGGAEGYFRIYFLA